MNDLNRIHWVSLRNVFFPFLVYVCRKLHEKKIVSNRAKSKIILLTCTLWAGIYWTIFADVASTAADGEAFCWWWCNDDVDNCVCCDCCVDVSSELLCVDADSPPNGSKLELPFSSTMLLSIATVLPWSVQRVILFSFRQFHLHFFFYFVFWEFSVSNNLLDLHSAYANQLLRNVCLIFLFTG